VWWTRDGIRLRSPGSNRASACAKASAFANASADRRSLGGGWSADRRSFSGGWSARQARQAANGKRQKVAVAFTLTLWIATGSATTTADPQSILTAQLSNSAIDADTRAALIAAAGDLEWRQARFEADGVAPVDIHVGVKRTSIQQQQRIVDAALLSMLVFGSWYGAAPPAPMVVIDVPWRSGLAGASYPGVIAIATRWMAPGRDMTVERSLIGAMARQFGFAAATHQASERWFDEALALYTGVRAVHEALENNDAATVRFFGSHIPVVIRPVQWSPNRADPRPRVRHFAEIDLPPVAAWRMSSAEEEDRAQRGALALHSLERYVGWPAMQEALSTYRERASATGGSAELFGAVVSEQRGRDLSWFFAEAFRANARFDYAVDDFTSEPSPDGSDQYQTTVAVRRLGDAIFAGTSEAPAGGFASRRGLTVAVNFEDGSVAEDFWDGRDGERRLEYMSRSRAVSASLDPRAVLLLDDDRTNNTRVLGRRFRPIGARLALHWMVWLQDLMLSYTALA
jgi:hypothetical protein